MKKIKPLFKIGILIFGITLFFLTGCEKDDTFNENISTVQKGSVIAKRVTLNEIKENQTLKQSLDKIEKQFDYFKKGNEFSKINSTDNSFSILTNEILQVTTDSTEAYTFRIETPTHSDSSFENFVIEKRNDNDYEFYIYRYKRLEFEENIEVTHSMSKELVSANQINLGDFQDILAAKMVYDETSGCLFDITVDENCECIYAEVLWCQEGGSSGGGGGGDSSGGNTGGSTGSSSTGGTGGLGGNNGGGYGDGSGGYTGGGYGGSGGGGGSSGGSGGPNPGSGGGSTIGVLPSPLDLAIDNFFDNLTDEQEDCLNTNFLLRKQIRIYLENNMELVLEADGNPNTNAQDFATQAIEAVCMEGEINLPDGIILDSTLINNQKVKCVYDKLFNISTSNTFSNSNNVFNNIINNYFDSSKNANIRFEIGNTPNGEDAITLPYIGNPNDTSSTSNYKIIINSSIVNNLSTLEVALIFIHESIHAELMERCFRLGLINSILMVNGLPLGVSFNTSPSNVYTLPDALFSALAIHYYNYNGGNSQWNHDLFTIGDYRTKMAQNLVNIHSNLNDSNNDFLTNVNNDPTNTFGNFTIQQLMDYTSWIGLEGTQDFINNIQNNNVELSKKNYVENVARTKYTNNCN